MILKMKLIEPGRQDACERVKRVKLYSDLIQVLKKHPIMAPHSVQGGP